MLYDYFISYRRSDRELVANAARRLEERGLNIWYDVEIEGGADWRETIVEALTQSEMLVIFFSEDCNHSRQLKKELAIADTLEKPVIPILIEDTKPRGAYLYELADRNWLQAFPDPMSKIDELVDHLVVLAGKLDAAAAATAPAAPEAAPESVAAALDSAESDVMAPAPIAKEEAPAAEKAARKSAAPPQSSSKAAPRASDAYVGKVSERAKSKPAPTNDILPFRWIDLVFLGPLLLLFAGHLLMDGYFQHDSEPLFEPISILIMCLGAVGLYGALVFPFRYYMRRRRFWSALGKYVVSSFILYGLFIAGFFVGYAGGIFPDDDPFVIAAVSGGIWIGYAVLAFIIYGILNAQRAVRTFHRNIKKI